MTAQGIPVRSKPMPMAGDAANRASRDRASESTWQLGVQRVLRRLATLPFESGIGPPTLTCSAGLAERRLGESVLAAIERADEARAKPERRNRLVCTE